MFYFAVWFATVAWPKRVSVKHVHEHYSMSCGDFNTHTKILVKIGFMKNLLVRGKTILVFREHLVLEDMKHLVFQITILVYQPNVLLL